MARGTTLAILQPNLGKSTRDVLVNVLQRTQRRLWEDYGWPFLRITRDIEISINQRYYDLPTDMTFERIEKAEFKHGDYWTKLDYGIGARQYNQFDSDRNITSYPIQCYDNYENNQIELWPIPSTNSTTSTKQGMVRFHGIKNLNGLIAEMLARQKQADAQNKLAQAQAHYARLKARLSKTETFIIGGGEPEGLYRPKSPPLIATTSN